MRCYRQLKPVLIDRELLEQGNNHVATVRGTFQCDDTLPDHAWHLGMADSTSSWTTRAATAWCQGHSLAWKKELS